MRDLPGPVEGPEDIGPSNAFNEFWQYAQAHRIGLARLQRSDPSSSSPVGATGGLYGFADRLVWLLDGLVRSTPDGNELRNLAFWIAPTWAGDHRVIFSAVISWREMRKPVLLSSIGEAIAAGTEQEQELALEIAHLILQRFRDGRSEPFPHPPHLSPSNPSAVVVVRPNSCSNCVYLMRGAPNICNAFHTIPPRLDAFEDPTDEPTECPDHKRQR